MSAIACLLFLTPLASGGFLPPQQLENFFDSVLQEGRYLISTTTTIPRNDLTTDYVVFSVSEKGVSIRGPTTLERKGSATGTQTAEQAHAEALVKLGNINVDVKEVTINFFGYSYSTEVHFAILNAEAPITVDVFRNNLATCQVSVNVLRPVGNYVVRLGPPGAPALLSAILDYGITYLIGLLPIAEPFIMDRHYLPDILSHIDNQITIAAKRIAC